MSQISSKMKELNATLAIMITDTWVANETQKNSVTGSQHHPFSGSAEALMVAIWGPMESRLAARKCTVVVPPGRLSSKN